MTDTKIKIKNLYKVFGADPKSAMEQVRNGVSKQDLLEKHSHLFKVNAKIAHIRTRAAAATR